MGLPGRGRSLSGWTGGGSLHFRGPGSPVTSKRHCQWPLQSTPAREAHSPLTENTTPTPLLTVFDSTHHRLPSLPKVAGSGTKVPSFS